MAKQYIYATVKVPAEVAIRPILSGTPKQLEIAVTRTKQNTEVISNRDTNTTPSNALGGCGKSQNRRHDCVYAFSRKLFSQSNLAGLSQRHRARHTAFLIVSPKRLEIAVSQRKQNTEVISNRMKIDPLLNATERLCEHFAQECDEGQDREQDARAKKRMKLWAGGGGGSVFAFSFPLPRRHTVTTGFRFGAIRWHNSLLNRRSLPHRRVIVPATWTGYITFGLISIPIELTPAARSERISFNQIHSVCHTRLKQPLFCPSCDKFVDRSEVQKGYEYEKDQYLLFTKDELEEIEPDSARTMEILSFVKVDEIDPVYFESSYYAKPGEAGVRAYNLLLDAMRKTGYAGIAKVTMHNRENIVIIRARENGFTLHTMFYKNEIRASDVSAPNKPEVSAAEANLAIQLIESLAAPFDPSQYSDTYQQELEKLIEAKAHGKKLTVVPRGKIEPVADLMAALKRSLKSKDETAKKGVISAVPKPGEKKSRKTA
jgi:DNA end-binding protein Ku